MSKKTQQITAFAALLFVVSAAVALLLQTLLSVLGSQLGYSEVLYYSHIGMLFGCVQMRNKVTEVGIKLTLGKNATIADHVKRLIYITVWSIFAALGFSALWHGTSTVTPVQHWTAAVSMGVSLVAGYVFYVRWTSRRENTHTSTKT